MVGKSLYGFDELFQIVIFHGAILRRLTYENVFSMLRNCQVQSAAFSLQPACQAKDKLLLGDSRQVFSRQSPVISRHQLTLTDQRPLPQRHPQRHPLRQPPPPPRLPQNIKMKKKSHFYIYFFQNMTYICFNN
jgi:hypothetical protein